MTPKPGEMTYPEIVGKIKSGALRVPQFQRDFVWDKQASARLLDSVIKGFPIGTFILWKTREELRTVKGIGSLVFPVKEQGDYVYYILDGQQRITSLFACLEGSVIRDAEGRESDYGEIWVDLEADEDGTIISDYAIEGHKLIKLTELVHSDLISLIENYDKIYIKRIDELRKRIDNYRFSTVSIEDATIDVATEIFTRLNIGGKKLSLFEIMVAKTYEEGRFDLAEQYDALIEELREKEYETLPDSTLLQAVSACIKNDCTKKAILSLTKKEIITYFEKVVSALKSAIDYLKSYYHVAASELLPYDGLLVPFAYFFYHHPEKPLDGKRELLQDYFWRIVLNERFSKAMDTRITQDIKRIDTILAGKQPRYEEGVTITVAEFKRRGWFSTGRAYIKGMLCILADAQPRSFADHATVNIDNDWLKQANSKNYHHFFPKAYLAKKSFENYANHIANITIVDDYLNKQKIKARAPSDYISEFAQKNPKIDETMRTHLIMDLQKFGIWTDDYDTFVNERSLEFCKRLKERIIPIQGLDEISLEQENS